MTTAELFVEEGANVTITSKDENRLEDVAKAILYFASDDSSWATGAVLPLDGGMAAR